MSVIHWVLAGAIAAGVVVTLEGWAVDAAYHRGYKAAQAEANTETLKVLRKQSTTVKRETAAAHAAADKTHKEVKHALGKEPDWASQPVPASVRAGLCDSGTVRCSSSP